VQQQVASAASSKVARNAAKRSFGRSRMNPTVSVIDDLSLLGEAETRERVSSVAKSLSSAMTSRR
jgi:uncharacterized membrane protein YdfJ with MMPL/SSD domain